MKLKKIIAVGMSMAMVLGVASGCKKTETVATTEAVPTQTEETNSTEVNPAETEVTPNEPEVTQEVIIDEKASLEGFTDLGADAVANEGEKIVVWSWNSELSDLIKEYSAVDFEYVEIGNGNLDEYREALDKALESGDAPDLFAIDAESAQLYLNSDKTLPINRVGLDYGDLTNMYDYTLQFAADNDGVIKGLTWQSSPSAIFYNRTLATEFLGVTEPEDVAQFFATWDDFITTARDVNERSEGEVKIVSGVDDIWRACLGSRTQSWMNGENVTIDPVMHQYFDLAKILSDEDLTNKTSQLTDEWVNNASNSSTLAYLGPMSISRYFLHLDNEEFNPTAGEWGVVNAPASFFWGGTWICASSQCDMKSDAGQILYDLCISQNSLEKMAQNGEFVNSVSIMKDVSTDPSFAVDWLDNQNPVGVLLDSATTATSVITSPDEDKINYLFKMAVDSYLAGDFETVEEAEASFEANVKDLGTM